MKSKNFKCKQRKIVIANFVDFSILINLILRKNAETN
jgi:hypothetical protein